MLNITMLSMTLLPYRTKGIIEVGVDESGRGPIIGRVYSGAVVWPDELVTPMIKDSKKYKNASEREKAYDYIIDNAIAYGVAYVEPEEIDAIGIYKSVMKAMHMAIRNININPDHILVDGNLFIPYVDSYGDSSTFTTVIGGDNTYLSIAGGSILAKVEHDRYINDLCDRYPILEKYDLRRNKGYGTSSHMEAIQKYGVTQFHRQSFRCCQDLPITYI
jgi:ribonuclease HII